MFGWYQILISSEYLLYNIGSQDAGFVQKDLIPRQDILKDKWSPALQIRTVLLSIQALLSAPNPDDPLANDVAQLWKQNEQQAIRTAKYVPLNVLFFLIRIFKGMDCPACEVTNHKSLKEIDRHFLKRRFFFFSPMKFALTSNNNFWPLAEGLSLFPCPPNLDINCN